MSEPPEKSCLRASAVTTGDLNLNIFKLNLVTKRDASFMGKYEIQEVRTSSKYYLSPVSGDRIVKDLYFTYLL